MSLTGSRTMIRRSAEQWQEILQRIAATLTRIFQVADTEQRPTSDVADLMAKKTLDETSMCAWNTETK